jgi:hypothetical protein
LGRRLSTTIGAARGRTGSMMGITHPDPLRINQADP